MSESEQPYKSIFEIAEEHGDFAEPMVVLESGVGVNIYKALKDIYLRIQDLEPSVEVDDLLFDVDLLATLILSNVEDFARDKMIKIQANMLTEQLEREINYGKDKG
jgi:RNA processing factor Prp31